MTKVNTNSVIDTQANRIVLFVTSVFDTANSGPATFGRILHQSFSEIAYKFIVITTDSKLAHDSVVCIKNTGFAPLAYVKLWLAARKISKQYSGSEVILHYNNTFPYLAFGKIGHRSILQMNDYYTMSIPYVRNDLNGLRTKLSHIFRKITEQISINRADLILCNSKYTLQQAQSHFPDQQGKFQLLYKSLDLQSLNTRANRTPTGSIIYIGNALHRKGFDILVAALAHTSAVNTLHIIGPRAQNKDLIRMLRQLPPHITVFNHGILPHSVLYALTAEQDLMVLPVRYEALGVSVIEGLAQGLPVLTTGVGGLKEVLEGYPDLFSSELNANPKVLGANIDIIFKNYEFYRKIVVDRVPEIRERFNHQTMINNIKQYYSE